MKLAVINSSPKLKNSISSILIKDLKEFLNNDIEIYELNLNSDEAVSNGFSDTLSKCDTLLLAVPVYIDSIPSHLLKAMVSVEKTDKSLDVYAISNSGFTGGINCRIALDIVKNWCIELGFNYMGGIGYGGGGSLGAFRDLKAGEKEKESLFRALELLSDGINNKKSFENYYTSINLSPEKYRDFANGGWRRAVVKNGLTEKDLFRKV